VPHRDARRRQAVNGVYLFALRHMNNRPPRLVVIAIIATLIGLLLPAVQ
jgi:hypothetical protein